MYFGGRFNVARAVDPHAALRPSWPRRRVPAPLAPGVTHLLCAALVGLSGYLYSAAMSGMGPLEALESFLRAPVFRSYSVACFAVPAYALAVGGSVERAYGAFHLACGMVMVTLMPMLSLSAHVEMVLLTNLLILLWLSVLALGSGPAWTLVAAGLQTPQVAILLAAWLDPRIEYMTATIAGGAFDCFLLATFAYGSWRAGRLKDATRRRREPPAGRPEGAPLWGHAPATAPAAG